MITSSQIRTASDQTAWKTASMRGYLFKTALDAETYGAGAYKLTFKKNDGTGYDFYFNVDTTVYTGTIPNATDLVLDAELLGHILNQSWQTSTAKDCEQARTGGGSW